MGRLDRLGLAHLGLWVKRTTGKSATSPDNRRVSFDPSVQPHEGTDQTDDLSQVIYQFTLIDMPPFELQEKSNDGHQRPHHSTALPRQFANKEWVAGSHCFDFY